MFYSLRLFILLLFVGMPLSSHAATIGPGKITQPHIIVVAQISKQQAANIAQQYVRGRVLKVTLSNSVYRVKIVSQSGDVISVMVDAMTGQILNR